MRDIALTVYGLPAPQGSKSFKGMTKGKDGKKPRAILVESSAKVKPWREDVRAAAADLLLRLACSRGVPQMQPLDGPLRVRMVFTLPKPASAPKRRRTWPDRMPDLSKLIRSTEDALTSAGLWKDDARVVEYARAAKVYPGEDPEALHAPGVRIVIECLGE